MTVVNYFGVKKSAWLTRLVVAVVLAVLAAVVVAVVASGDASLSGVATPASVSARRGVAGGRTTVFRLRRLRQNRHIWAKRCAIRPARFPRAIPLALGITLVVYSAVAVATLAALGPERLARSTCAAERRRASKRCRVAGAGGQRWSRRRCDSDRS